MKFKILDPDGLWRVQDLFFVSITSAKCVVLTSAFVCLSVRLTGIYKNYKTDFHETFMWYGSGEEPLNFGPDRGGGGGESGEFSENH